MASPTGTDAARPFTEAELERHVERARSLKWRSLSAGLVAVGLMLGVFVVPSVVPVPAFFEPVMAIPGGYRIWVLLWAAPMLLSFGWLVRFILGAVRELEQAAPRIRAVDDPACVTQLLVACRGTDTLTTQAAREALARLAPRLGPARTALGAREQAELSALGL